MKYMILLLAFVNLNYSYTTSSLRDNENRCFGEPPVIKSIVEYTINSEGFRENKTVFSFDEEGNLTQRVKLKDDIQVETDIYQYDDGRLFEKCIGLHEHFDPEDSELRCAYIESYQYDEFGRTVKSIAYDTSSLSNPITKLYYYDSNNRLVNVKQMNEDEMVQKEIEYNYNHRGTLRKKMVRDRQGELVEKYLYRYDQDDKMILKKSTLYFDKGKRTFKSEYGYNLLGDRIKETKYRRGEIIATKNREIIYYE